MRVAYLRIPDFEIGLERLRGVAPNGAAVVLGGSAHDRLPARRVSPEAAAEGVTEGMPLREAAARCPSAVFLPYDAAAYEEESEQLLGLLSGYSDAVEPDGAGCAYIDSAGWGSVTGRLEMGRKIIGEPPLEKLGAVVGIAPTRFTARMAALSADRGKVMAVPEWMEAIFLSDLPVERLPLGEKNLRKLRRLGVRTIGEFAFLPGSEVKLQFGAEGQAARGLSLGEGPYAVSPPARPGELSAYRTFEPAVNDMTVLRALVGKLIAGMCGGLSSSAAELIQVRLFLASGSELRSTARPPEATASADDLVLAAGRALERLEVLDGVDRLEVRLLGIRPEAGRQMSLWDAGQAADLARALAKLREQFGASRLRKAVALDPASPLPRRQFALVEIGS